MNIRDMQYAFGMHLSQFDEPLEASSDDIEYWLNQSQIKLVTEKFNGLNQEKRGFEQSQERIDDLQNLLKDETIYTSYYSSSKLSDFEADYIEFPDDKLYLINHKSEILYNYPSVTWEIPVDINKRAVVDGEDSTRTRRGNRLARQGTIHSLLHDPFNTTTAKDPLATIQDNKIIVYTDKTFIVNKINILYLKRPVDVNIKAGTDSELPEHLHKELIRKAVDMFLNNTRQLKQRLQRETPIANQERNEQNNE